MSPVDARISLGVQPPPLTHTPFQVLGQMAELRDMQQRRELQQQQIRAAQAQEEQRRQDIAEQQRQQAELAQYREIVSQNLPRADFVAAVQARAPGQIDAVHARLAEHDERAARMEKLNLEVDRERALYMGEMAEDIARSNYDPMVASATLTELAQKIPAWEPKITRLRMQLVEGGPEALKAAVDRYRPRKAPVELNKDTTLVDPVTGQEIAKGPQSPKPEPTSIDQALAAARNNPMEWNRLLKLKAQESAAGRVPTEGPKPAWQWVVRNGKEVYTNRVSEGDRPQNARVKATEDERKTAGFYGQMSDAITILDELEPRITQQELYQIQTLPQEKLVGLMNRNLLSEDAKRYLRAFEQFTESRLRPVSGAAIVDSEYERDRRTYAKQYGETPKLAADRVTARNRALESLKTRAGVALDDANRDEGDVIEFVRVNGKLVPKGR